MPISVAVAGFFILWWMVLFAVLPFGVRSQMEAGAVVPGSEPGAPSKPYLLRKLVATTLVTILVMAGIIWYIGIQF